MGYGPFKNSYRVVNPAKVQETGKVSVILTRDVKIKLGEYPMLQYQFKPDFRCTAELDAELGIACGRCKKLRVPESTEVTCPACKDEGDQHHHCRAQAG